MKELSKNTSTLLFILLTGVLVVIAFTSYNKIMQFNKSVDLVMETQIVKDNIIELRSIVKDAESGQRGFLITNDSVFLQPVIGAEQRSNLIFAKYDSLISDNAGQQENLKKLKTFLDERYLLLNKTLKSFKNNPSTNLPTDSLLLESKNKMDEVRKQIALMLQTEDKLLEQRIHVKDRSATLTPIFLLLLSLFSIVALTLFFFRLQKETNSRVSTAKLVEVEAEARKQIEENFREISDYKYALDESSIVAITDQKGIINYVNDNFCTISKYTRQELIGQDHRIINSGYHSKDFIRNLWTIVANGKTWKGKLKNRAKDGTIYWVDTTIVPFLNELGKPYQYVAIKADITEQKKSEEAIEKMAAHLTLATDSANVGTWSFNVQTQELEWSAVHKSMWGYDEHRTDLTYEDWHKLILPGDKEKAFEKIEEAKDNHTSYDVEYFINRANDDALRCIRSVGNYYYNDKGEAETLTGISIDITEKNQIEDTLRYRQALLEAHNEANRDGLLLVDAKGKIISYNQSFIDVWRMPKEIVDSKDDELALAFAMTQLVNPQQFIDKVKWLYEHPSETSIDELEYLDGRIIERHGYSVIGEDGTYYAWSWTFRDITEQKAAAEAIKESEERVSNERIVLYNSFMNAPAAIAIVKGDTFIYEFANTEYERLLDRKIIIGKTVQELFPELEAQGIMAMLNNVFTTGEPFIANEFPVELMNKSTGKLVLGYYNTVIQPMTDERGNTERLLSHGVEVTLQVKARKQIEASEKRFSMLADSIPNLAWMAYADGSIFWFNKKWFEYTGTTLADMEGWGWQSVHDPEELPKVLIKWRASIETGQPFEMVFPLKGSDGKFRQFLTRVLPVYDSGNEIYRWFGTNTDIDEEKMLTEEKFLLEFAEDFSHYKTGDKFFDSLVTYIANKTNLDYVFIGKLTEKPALPAGREKNIFTIKTIALANRGILVPNIEYPLPDGPCEQVTRGTVYNYPNQCRITFPKNQTLVQFNVEGYVGYPLFDSDGKAIGLAAVMHEKEILHAEYVSALLKLVAKRAEYEMERNTNTHRLHIQNETFKQAEESSMQGSYSFNLTTDKLTYSDNLFRLIGYEPNEFEPSLEEFNRHVHPQDRDFVQKAAEKVLHSKTADEWHYRMNTKTGTLINIKGTGRVIESGDDKLLVGTLQDVTKEFELNKELQEKEAYRRQIINNAPDAVIVCNEKSMITLWNPKTEEIFGWKAKEVLGLHLADTIIPAQYREAHKEGMKRLLKTGEVRILNKTLELTALNKAGKEFPVSLTISQATQQGNKLYIAFLKDITLEKQNKEELIVKTEQLARINHSLELKNIELENTNAELNSFTYVASHDLQEPLRKIQVFSKRILEVEEFSDNTQDYFNRIIAAGERMQNLIVSLLDFSSTSATELIFEPCDLNAIVEESKDNLQLSIIEKQAVVEYENLPTINAARLQLSQLFTNLIDNAIKYSRPEIKPHIKITASIIEGKIIEHTSVNKQTSYHAIQFADNGIGFEQEYENKIFELFQRLHAKNEYSGTGIGLGIVKKIVNNHNGFIIAKGEPNTGATFTIYIPTT